MAFSFQQVSLRNRILGSLFLVFLLTLAGALFGMWTYQQERLVAMTSRRAMQAGFTVEAGLRTAMLANDRDAVRAVIAEMVKVADLAEISILDPRGRVAISSRRAREGLVINRDVEPTCQVCHENGARPTPGKAAVFEDNDGRYLLRSVVKIENRPPCFRCHPPDNAICGILVVDSSLDDTFDLIRTVAWRSLLTGLVSFCLVALLISLIVNRFVSRPVRALMEGIKHVEEGDFSYWVEVEGGGEFGEMADSFNVMSRAIVRYIEEIKAKNNEISSLYTLVRKISETIDIRKLRVIVVNLLLEILRAEDIVLALPADGDDGRFELVWKSRGEKHYVSEYFAASEIAPHRILSRDELTAWAEGRFGEPRFLDHNTRALVPLANRNMRFGLLAISRGREAFSHSDKNLIPALAHHVEIAFTNAWLYDMAITDELTSLYTKRHFQTKLAGLEENYRMTGEGFAVMMIDLDRFKEINDTHGHPVGDRMLSELAGLIRANLRMGEIPCRYGGDEFVVLLPINDVTTVRMVAERVRGSISEHWFEYEGVERFRMTASIGVACCPQHAAGASELVMVADSALYRAKEAGRDRVQVAGMDRGPDDP